MANTNRRAILSVLMFEGCVGETLSCTRFVLVGHVSMSPKFQVFAEHYCAEAFVGVVVVPPLPYHIQPYRKPFVKSELGLASNLVSAVGSIKFWKSTTWAGALLEHESVPFLDRLSEWYVTVMAYTCPCLSDPRLPLDLIRLERPLGPRTCIGERPKRAQRRVIPEDEAAFFGLAHLGDRVPRVAASPDDEVVQNDVLPLDDEVLQRRGDATCGPDLDAAEWFQIAELSDIANVDDADADREPPRPLPRPRPPRPPPPPPPEPYALGTLYLDKDMNVLMEGRRHRFGFLRWWQLKLCALLATCKCEGPLKCPWFSSYGPEVGGLERLQQRLASWLAAGGNLSEGDHMRLRGSVDLRILSLEAERI